MKIIEFSLRRRVTVAMAAIAVSMFGAVAFSRLPINLLPDISYPSLTVESRFPGAAPAEVENFVTRRAAGEPLQYLEGLVEFGPVELLVDERALIPRPETEAVWDEARRMLGEAGRGTVIVDLCTGSGAMAMALKTVFPEAKVFATDLSEDALALAKENAARLGLDIQFSHGDLFEALPKSIYGRIDLLVSNPPYVTEGEWEALPSDVRDYEPSRALVAGPDGTATRPATPARTLSARGVCLCELQAGDCAESGRV